MALQCRPGEQSSQVVAPSSDWKEPSGHFEQAGAPSPAAKVPAEHGVGATLPVEHEWPTGHAVQLSACHRSVPLEYEPDGHGSGADAPSAQYDPATHAKHAVLPLALW